MFPTTISPRTARRWHIPRFLRSHALPFGPGMYAGACLAIVLWAFWSHWGTSLSVTSALLLAASFSLAVGTYFGGVARPASVRQRAGARVALSVVIAAASTLSGGMLGVLRWIPLSALEDPLVTATLAGIAASVTVGSTIFLLQFLARSAAPQGLLIDRAQSPQFWAGMALSLLLVPLTIGLWWGMATCAWILAAGGLALAAAELRRGSTIVPCTEAELAACRVYPRPHHWELSDLIHVLSGLVIGAGGALTLHVSAQLVVQMSYVVFAQLGGVLGGIAIGLLFCARRLQRTNELQGPFGIGILIAVAGLALLTAGFGWLIEAHLWLTAYVSQVWILMPLRAVFSALALVPCGVALAVTADERPIQVRGHLPSDLAHVAVAAAIGFTGLRWLAIEPDAIVAWFVIGASGLGVLLAWAARPVFRTRRAAAIGLLAGAAVLPAGLWNEEYDPARSARLLFSTSVFAAYRAGSSPGELMVQDDGRLVTTCSNGRSTWTVWKHHGAQLQFRENGAPRHITSLDLAVCPQASAELLPSVVPLVLHPQPRDVLLTGLGGTATLQSCLAFPVASITCTEPDPALLQVAREFVSPELRSDPLRDSRVRIVEADPVLAAAAGDRTYDVIIVASTQPALFSGSGTMTREYYGRMASRLSPGGVLCQRFQYIDFGAWPLCEMAATLRSVFSRVFLLESAPGEVLLIAMQDDGPPIDAALISRVRSPHVRRVMSQAGWDWSVLLALAALDEEAVAELARKARPNSAADGRFSFQLAPEVMRWGPKLDEIQRLVAAHSSRMLNWIGACPETEEVAQRLADVTEQHRTIHENPDAFWAYRKTLKQRLQNRPRSVIVPVSHEGLQRRLHPEDERRKEYLLALGAAARQRQPAPDSIIRLSQFVEPFDPLVSYFVHHEAAYLWSRSAAPDRRAEFAHRLYTVYYGAGSDRSVRNVTAALRIAVDEPDVFDSPDARWDHLNALLEVLRHRWAARLQSGNESRYAAADLDTTLDVARDALRVMDELQAEVPVQRADWMTRRELLERELIQPVKVELVEQVEHRSSVARRRASAAEASPPNVELARDQE